MIDHQPGIAGAGSLVTPRLVLPRSASDSPFLLRDSARRVSCRPTRRPPFGLTLLPLLLSPLLDIRMFPSPTKRNLTESNHADRACWSPSRVDLDDETVNKLWVPPSSFPPLFRLRCAGRCCCSSSPEACFAAAPLVEKE